MVYIPPKTLQEEKQADFADCQPCTNTSPLARHCLSLLRSFAVKFKIAYFAVSDEVSLELTNQNLATDTLMWFKVI